MTIACFGVTSTWLKNTVTVKEYDIISSSSRSYSTVALVPPMSTMDVWRGIT